MKEASGISLLYLTALHSASVYQVFVNVANSHLRRSMALVCVWLHQRVEYLWFISLNQISFFRGANVHRSHMGPIRDSGRGWGAGGVRYL